MRIAFLAVGSASTVVASGATSGLLLLAQETPTTIVGAFIFVALSMAALVGYVIKKLLDDSQKNQDQFTDSLKSVVEHCESEAKAERETSERRYSEQSALMREQHAEQMEAFQRLHETGRESVHAMRGLMQAITLRTRLADAMQSTELPAWTKTLDGVLMSWNPACERALGWKAQEVVGKSVYDCIIPPEKRREEEDVLKKIAAGETVNEYETMRMHRAGRRVRMLVVTSPILDRDGKVTGASTIAHEV